MRKHLNTFRRLLALLLVMGIILLFPGCSRTKDAGSEVIDTKNQKFLLINVDTNVTDPVQLTVRLLTMDKESGSYITAEEYTPGQIENGNVFGLVLEEKGVYEVIATCGDLEPVRHIVEVTKNQVYVVNLIFAAPEELPQETEALPGA